MQLLKLPLNFIRFKVCQMSGSLNKMLAENYLCIAFAFALCMNFDSFLFCRVEPAACLKITHTSRLPLGLALTQTFSSIVSTPVAFYISVTLRGFPLIIIAIEQNIQISRFLVSRWLVISALVCCVNYCDLYCFWVLC